MSIIACTLKAGARHPPPCYFRVLDEDMYELPAVDQQSWILVALSANTSVRIRSLEVYSGKCYYYTVHHHKCMFVALTYMATRSPTYNVLLYVCTINTIITVITIYSSR